MADIYDGFCWKFFINVDTQHLCQFFSLCRFSVCVQNIRKIRDREKFCGKFEIKSWFDPVDCEKKRRKCVLRHQTIYQLLQLTHWTFHLRKIMKLSPTVCMRCVLGAVCVCFVCSKYAEENSFACWKSLVLFLSAPLSAYCQAQK